MPEDTKEENLGVSIEVFHAAVTVLKNLVDNGQFILFLPRLNWIRIIGDRSEFRSVLKKTEPAETSDKNVANRSLREIKTVLGAVVKYDYSEDSLREYLLRYLFDTDSDLEDAPDALKDVMEEKIRCVREKLPVSSLIRRAKRLETAGSGCFEDLDVDVIRERRDEIESMEINEPFLRLRVRYSDPESRVFPGMFYMAPPGFPVDPDRTFELEADATDIDLLIKRLGAAKKRLIAEEAPEKEDNNP